MRDIILFGVGFFVMLIAIEIFKEFRRRRENKLWEKRFEERLKRIQNESDRFLEAIKAMKE